MQEFIEGIDEEALSSSPQTSVFLEHPKNIISENDSPDLHFKFSINPYQGCEHGCIYCYARNVHHYWGFGAGLDFEQKIIVKPEAPRLLEKRFLSKSWKPAMIMLSGNTDCYQPLERKYKLTRGLLQVFNKYKNPVGIITKNSLILRDLDLLKELSKDHLVRVMISITTLDEDLRRRMEPRTASGNKRLKVIEALSNSGVPVGVMTAPLIPGLNDHELPELLKRASESGAFDASYTVVRLNGAIGDLFKDWLHKNFPDKYNKVLHGIESLHHGQVNDSNWSRRQKGEGHVSQMIANLFSIAKKQYFTHKKPSPINLTKFRRGGNYELF